MRVLRSKLLLLCSKNAHTRQNLFSGKKPSVSDRPNSICSSRMGKLLKENHSHSGNVCSDALLVCSMLSLYRWTL